MNNDSAKKWHQYSAQRAASMCAKTAKGARSERTEVGGAPHDAKSRIERNKVDSKFQMKKLCDFRTTCHTVHTHRTYVIPHTLHTLKQRLTTEESAPLSDEV